MFFFSSRRRHTSWPRDWSSDVCSSDLDSTSAVDVKTESAIQEALKKNWQHCTNILIAQRISSVVNADHIIVLENGKIAAKGKHDTLLAESKIYQEIYQSQQRKEEILHA